MPTKDKPQVPEKKAIKFLQARVPEDLHLATDLKLTSEGLSFQWLVNEACRRYLGEEQTSRSLEARLAEWLQECHKNPADYLAAEFACRRALGIKAEDWEEFQKGLRK